jgi:hypothetical protein
MAISKAEGVMRGLKSVGAVKAEDDDVGLTKSASRRAVEVVVVEVSVKGGMGAAWSCFLIR